MEEIVKGIRVLEKRISDCKVILFDQGELLRAYLNQKESLTMALKLINSKEKG